MPHYNLRIKDSELWTAFKVKCVEDDVKIVDRLNDLVRDSVEGNATTLNPNGMHTVFEVEAVPTSSEDTGVCSSCGQSFRSKMFCNACAKDKIVG